MPGTLQDIRTKVRRITRNPSASQITDAQIDEYVNTFVLYDFPEQLRLFYLRRTLTFYTSAYVDTYSTTDVAQDDPLFDFKNKYITVHEPVYVAGYQIYYSQSRTVFFAQYPFINSLVQVANGNGLDVNFAGQLASVPFLSNNVTFNYQDTNGVTVSIKDDPIDNQMGDLMIADGAQSGTLVGHINYVTGVWDLELLTPIAANQPLNSLTVPYVQARPQGMLYFNDTFTLRPVPDQGYPVNLEVYAQPLALLESDQETELRQWWQYIAFGASKKIFEDTMDMESVALIMPAFKEQERLVLRTTLVQFQDQRTVTIYNQQAGLYGTPWGWGWGNGYF